MPKPYLKYNPQKIEQKWQKIWEKKKTFQVDLKKAKKPYYNLMMFPYPSAEGLHVGNVYAFTGSDIHGRFQRMQGYDVFEPIGFDAFGIHSENFALKKKIHPKVLIKKNTDNFRQQLKNLGCLFDWRAEVDTTQPDYYKWTQWLFLQLFRAGLAERKKAPVDWCPSCKTVLADEQVIGGKCERCESEVIQKETEQWFFKITKYAERLLKNLENIDWSERTKIAQKNWIGKSEGSLIKFQVLGSKLQVEVFTTRPDTLFGATYLVVAPEHEIISNIKSQISNFSDVENYIERAKRKTELERAKMAKEKTGVEIKGVKAINPATKQEIPIFVADYVLASYGTGAIMAVPAHDQRDFEFAKKYHLPVKMVICPNYPEPVCPVLDKAYEDEGYLVGSGKFDGMKSQKAGEEITKFVGGKKVVNYHLRDWLISRQRYWGPPIPVIFCENCKKQLESLKFSKGELENPGWIGVPEKDLPVLLPYVRNFRPKGTGKSPLASVKKWVNVACPECGGAGRRETDVSDTFLDSSWYYFAYLMKFENWKLGFGNSPFSNLIRKWCPIDMYIGGQEHAVLHLFYTRFITMALKDLGYLDFSAIGGEPFKKFRAHGLLTKGGAKMSKSKGNVVNPDEYYKEYGADTLRMYLMFLGPFEQGGDWQDKGIVGIKRFLEKVWVLSSKAKKEWKNPKIDILVHKTIKKVTEDLENLRYNTAISALMTLVNEMLKQPQMLNAHYQILLKMLAPFAPYISEELWLQTGGKGSIHNQAWPKYDSKLVKEETFTLVVQVNGKVRDKIELQKPLSEKEVKVLVLSREAVKKWIVGKEIKKVIFVQGKLINIVI